MKKFLVLLLTICILPIFANAQTLIKKGSVPKAVKTKYLKDNSKGKKAKWYKQGSDYMADFNGTQYRYTSGGQLVWKLKTINDNAIPSEIKSAYTSKYNGEYPMQSAKEATLADGKKYTFIIGKKQGNNYYFKYDSNNIMVEKTSTNK